MTQVPLDLFKPWGTSHLIKHSANKDDENLLDLTRLLACAWICTCGRVCVRTVCEFLLLRVRIIASEDGYTVYIVYQCMCVQITCLHFACICKFFWAVFVCVNTPYMYVCTGKRVYPCSFTFTVQDECLVLVKWVHQHNAGVHACLQWDSTQWTLTPGGLSSPCNLFLTGAVRMAVQIVRVQQMLSLTGKSKVTWQQGQIANFFFFFLPPPGLVSLLLIVGNVCVCARVLTRISCWVGVCTWEGSHALHVPPSSLRL